MTTYGISITYHRSFIQQFINQSGTLLLLLLTRSFHYDFPALEHFRVRTFTLRSSKNPGWFEFCNESFLFRKVVPGSAVFSAASH